MGDAVLQGGRNMKAARFHVAGEPLKVEQVAEPVLRPGSVIVRVLSAFVPPYVSDLVAEGSSFTLSLVTVL